MTCLGTAEADVLRFVTGFEMKHGRCPSTAEVAEVQFGGDTMTVAGAIGSLINQGRLRRALHSRQRKLQVLQPLPVPRAPDGEPLHFVRLAVLP